MNKQSAITADRLKTEKQTRFDALSGLTADQLTIYLDDFRIGNLRNLAKVMDAIEERDDVLASVVPKAKAAVARHGWEVLTVNTTDDKMAAQAQAQKEALEAFYNNLTTTSAIDQDERGGMSLLLRQMMDAKGKRYAIHNLVWSRGPDGYTAEFIQCLLWFFENTIGRMRFIQTAYGFTGVDMDEGAWLVTKGRGVMIACAVAWMFKHLPLRDWLIYSSRHGMPGIEGITDATKGTTEWNDLVDAVETAAAEFAWVRNRSSEIKTIEFLNHGTLPYPPLVERMDRAMAALWRGADLSTISAGQGEGSGASLQGGEAEIIEEDDIQWLSETLNYKVDPLILEYTFGKRTRALAYVKVLGAPKKQTDLDLRVDEFLTARGFPISLKSAAERYSRTLPQEDDELLTPPLAPPAVEGAPPLRGSLEYQPGSNEATPAQAKIAGELGVPVTWLAPLAQELNAIAARVQDGSLTDADLLQFLDAAIARLPELFAKMDVGALAATLEAAMGGAAMTGIRSKLNPPAE